MAGKRVLEHQIFAVALFGEECIGMQVHHINEDKKDNSAVNITLLTHNENCRARTGYRAMQPIKATHLDTGEVKIYESQIDAARDLGLSQSNIWRVLTGIYKQTGRWTFERVSYLREELID